MGTRADFYVGKGQNAEWIGSIAWDGDRDGIADEVLGSASEEDFRGAVAAFFAGRDDVTLPQQGWPWPWDDSGTSDCSYWFFDGRVWDARGEWEDAGGTPGDFYLPCNEPEPEWTGEEGMDNALHAEWFKDRERVEFPNMAARKAVTLGPRSGLITVSRS